MFISKSIQIILQMFGICFLFELTIILTITTITFLNNVFRNKKLQNYQKMLDNLTTSIQKNPSSISDVDENLIEKTIQKMDNEEISMLNNEQEEKNSSESDNSNSAKNEFLKALENLKKGVDEKE